MSAMAQEFLDHDPDSRETHERIDAVIGADAAVWSSPGPVGLRRGGFDSERCKLPHSHVKEQRVPCAMRNLVEQDGSVVGTTGYVCRYASKIRALMPDGGHHTMPGSSTHGRNDSRPKPRHFFEIDRQSITHAAIAGREGPDGLTRRRARNRELETRSGQAESVDRSSADMQHLIFAGSACVDSIVRMPTIGSDLPW